MIHIKIQTFPIKLNTYKYIYSAPSINVQLKYISSITNVYCFKQSNIYVAFIQCRLDLVDWCKWFQYIFQWFQYLFGLFMLNCVSIIGVIFFPLHWPYFISLSNIISFHLYKPWRIYQQPLSNQTYNSTF